MLWPAKFWLLPLILLTSISVTSTWFSFVSENALICALSEMTGSLLCLGLQLQGQPCWLLPGGLCHPSVPLLWLCHLTVWIREQRRDSGSMEIRQHRTLAKHSFISSAQGEGWKKYSCVSISAMALYNKMFHCFTFVSYTS